MNINDYIGLPYKEMGRKINSCDCYGLLRILYRDLKGIHLEAYENVKADRALHNDMIIAGQKDWQEIEKPGFGDVVCFKIMGLVSHVGMMIDQTNFIHAWNGTDSCIENINSIQWRHRVDGFFRYIN